MSVRVVRPDQRVHHIGWPGAVTVRHAGRPGAADWWDPAGEGLCIWAAYQPKGSGKYAASKLDLSGNGNHAGDPGGATTPAWDAVNGWKFNGLGNHLTTTFVPQADQSQTMIIQFTNGGGPSNNACCGTFELAAGNADFFTFYPNYPLGDRVYYYNGKGRYASPGMTAGNLCVSGDQGYRNGAADGGAIAPWTGVPTLAVYIGCWNEGTPTRFWSGYVQAFALYDCTLTAVQVAAVAAAMAAL